MEFRQSLNPWKKSAITIAGAGRGMGEEAQKANTIIRNTMYGTALTQLVQQELQGIKSTKRLPVLPTVTTAVQLYGLCYATGQLHLQLLFLLIKTS